MGKRMDVGRARRGKDFAAVFTEEQRKSTNHALLKGFLEGFVEALSRSRHPIVKEVLGRFNVKKVGDLSPKERKQFIAALKKELFKK